MWIAGGDIDHDGEQEEGGRGDEEEDGCDVNFSHGERGGVY